MRLNLAQYKSLLDKTAKRADPEGELQTICVAWFRSHPWLKSCQLVALPNEGKRSFAVAAKLRRQGMLAGVADLIMVRPHGHAVWIELKAPGKKQTEKQRDFMEECAAKGISYFVIDDFKNFERLALSLAPARDVRKSA
ncbi:MAG: VRR-NUC domain-containing protein [Burkholderiaceae bacterium]